MQIHYPVISFETTVPAATFTLSPIVIPGKMVAFAPIKVLDPIVTGR